MARWQITISGKGLRKTSVEKLAEKMKADFDGADVFVRDATPPESRADRFSDAQSQVSDAKSEFESLRDELQEWYDGLPENLQQGHKADELQSAIDQLEEVINQAEDVEGASVDFPSMY